MNKKSKTLLGQTLRATSLCCLLLAAATVAHAQFAGGAGTYSSPYIVTNAQQLDAVRTNLAACYRLANDIDLTDYLAPGGAGYEKWGDAGWMPIGEQILTEVYPGFKGNFDGNGKKITGLWINRKTTDLVGLFGMLNTDQTTNIYGINGLGVEIAEGKEVSGSECVGGLAGFCINSRYISNCYVRGNVSGSNRVGGLVGFLRYMCRVERCYATGNVSGGYQIGGLVGCIDNSTVGESFATGNVSATGNYAGGLVGANSTGGAISHCYATGNVSASDGVGGLIGYNVGVSINECYAAGGVTGTETNSIVGGFIGRMESGSEISGCYFNGEASGVWDGIGYLHPTIDPARIHITGLTYDEMTRKTNFKNWRFEATLYWKNCESMTMPHLFWEKTEDCSLWRKVWFEANISGLPKIPDKAYLLGSLIEAPQLPQVVDMYHFAGWFTDNNTFLNPWNFETDIITDDLYLYAKWIKSFEGGDGSEADPYRIGNAEQLDRVREYLDKSFIVINDIDLTEFIENNYASEGWLPIGNNNGWFTGNEWFTGKFDGREKVISGLWINRPATDGIGLFGAVMSATITNTSVAIATGKEVKGKQLVGGLVGVNVISTISYCKTTGNVSGTDNVGGLVGWHQSLSTIKGCDATGDVSGSTGIGGLVGESYNSTISTSRATGKVTGTGNAVGGLVGTNTSGAKINEACYATGDVSGNNNIGGLVGNNHYQAIIQQSFATGKASGSASVGGLAGVNNEANILESYATGNVNGSNNVGGLAGTNENQGVIADCYAKGDVNTTDRTVGGLVGHNNKGLMIIRSYVTGKVTGSLYAGGIVGYNNIASTNTRLEDCFFDTQTTGKTIGIGYNQPQDATVFGKTTIEMRQIGTYKAWDDRWDICDGRDYPLLHWQSAYYDKVTCPLLVSFAGDEINIDEQSIQSGKLAVKPPTPKRGGYVFGGWFIDNGTFLNEWIFETRTVTQDITLYAKWIAIFDGGTGEAGSPYQISTAEQLNEVKNFLGKSFILMNDIDLAEFIEDNYTSDGWLPIGTSVNPFTGNFNGNDKVISGLWINRANTDDIGLFGSISGSCINNTGIEIANGKEVKGYDKVGGLTGSCTNASEITACYASGNVNGNRDIGGLVGDLNTNSFISNCYATGNVNADDRTAGGLVGANSGLSITNCYAAGKITTNRYAGGLAGWNGTANTTFTNCFFDRITSGQTNGIGYNSVAGVTGKTTAEMRVKSTFTDWNFYNIWTINQYVSYPTLLKAGEIIVFTVTFEDEGASIAQQQILNGKQAVEPALRYRAGYNFSGWFVDNETFQTEWDFENNIVTHDITLYAKWTAIFDGGTGEAGSPFQISTAEQLNEVRINLDKSYILMNDIDLTQFLTDNSDSGQGWLPIGTNAKPFTGNFDGNGKVISGLWINRGTDYNGLFGRIVSATIQNLGVEISSAGIIGKSNTGGLAGACEKTTIEYCYTTGNVTGASTAIYIGGLVGQCTADNIVIIGGDNPNDDDTRTNIIRYCYTTSDVSGGGYLGGLTGGTSKTTIDNCYAAGKVTNSGGGNIVGGLVGNNGQESPISNSFYNDIKNAIDITGSNFYLSPIINVYGGNDGQMRTKLFFTSGGNWDFDKVWSICEDESYPWLQWQALDCGTPPAPTYGLSIATFDNGTVTAGKDAYKADETVILTISPAVGYELDVISAFKTGEPLNTVTLGGAGNSRNFTMPSYGVTVTATFKKTQETSDAEAVAAAKSLIEGGIFTVAQAVANTEAEVKDWLIAQINVLIASEGISLTTADITLENFIVADDGTDGSFDFTVALAKGDATSSASKNGNTIEATALFTVTFDAMTNGSVTADKTSAAAGETITLTITPDTDYELDDINGYKTGEATTTVTIDDDGAGSTGSPTTGSPTTRTFTMPAFDVTVTATFRLSQAIRDADDVAAAKAAIENASYIVAEAVANTEPDVKTWLAAQINTLITSTGITVTESDITLSDFTAADGGMDGGFDFTVSLSKGNVGDTAVKNGNIISVASVYTVTVGGSTNGSVSSDKTFATAGETITLTIVPASGFELDEIAAFMTGEATTTVTIDDGGVAGSTSRTFTMPAFDVTVTATFRKTQATLDAEDVTAAKAAIENATFTLAQATANTLTAVQAWLTTQINALIASTGITVTESEITLSNFTAASGVDGNFDFTVALSKGSAGDTATKNGNTISATLTCTVTIGLSANGIVTANKTTAATAETVTLDIIPASGFELEAIEACMTGNPATIVTLAGSGNTRTFTMPAHDVTITAAFRKTQATLDAETVAAAKIIIENATFIVAQASANAEATVKTWLVTQINTLLASTGITVTESDITLSGFTAASDGVNGNFSFTVALAKGASTATAAKNGNTITATPVFTVTIGATSNGSVIAGRTTAAAFETVTLAIVPSTGFEPAAITAFKTGEPATTVTLAGADPTLTFDMPAHDVTVTATFRKTQATLDTEAVAAAKYAIENRSYTVAQATANTEADVKTWLAGQINSLIASTGITVTAGDITPANFTAASGADGSFDFTVALSKGSAGVTATKNGNTISETLVYTVTIGLTVDGSVTADRTTASSSETVTLTIAPSTGFELEAITACMTDNPSTSVPLIDADPTCTFEMPACDVTVTATFRKMRATLNAETVAAAKAAIENAAFTVGQSTANTEVALKTWLSAQINALISSTGISVTESDITLTGFTAASDGVDGIFSFFVTLTEGGFSDTAAANGTVSATPVYIVTVGTIANGSVTSDRTTASPSETVTLTIAPSAGFELDVITVFKTGEPATVVPLTGAGDSRTFTMPAFDVTVSATFLQTQAALDAADVAAAKAAVENASFTVAETVANTQTAVITWLVTQINALTTTYGITVSTSDLTPGSFNPAGSGTDGSFNFTVTLVKGTAVATATKNGNTITATPVYTVATGTFAGGSVTANRSSFAAGETVTLTITPDAGFALTAINARKTGDNTVTVALTGAGATRTFPMPAHDVTITATFAKTQATLDAEAVAAAKAIIENATFTVAQTTANTLTAVQAWLTTQINTLIASTTITVTAGNITLNSFAAASAGVNGNFNFTVALAKGASTTTAAKNGNTITATVTYTVTVGATSNGSVSANRSSCAAGETVTLTITPAAGYELSSIAARKTGDNTVSITLTGAGTTRTFTMPAHPATITATFAKTQATLNAEAVAAAKAAIENAVFTVAQATANTEATLRTWLRSQINALISSTGITVTESEIILNNFAAASAGVNGNFSFTVALAKGVSSATATKNGNTITATPVYSVTVGTMANGRLSTDKTSATQGETVTLTVTPDAGYELETITAHRTGTVTTTVAINGAGNTGSTGSTDSPTTGSVTRTFTMPAYPVTVTATFRKTQAQQDKEAVEAAKVAIEGGAYRIAQATGNDAAGVKTWLLNTLNILLGQSFDIQLRSMQLRASAPISAGDGASALMSIGDVQLRSSTPISVGDASTPMAGDASTPMSIGDVQLRASAPMAGNVTITAISPAIAGTEASPNGTNGSFSFTVSISCGATTLVTKATSGVIIATPNSAIPVKRIELLPIGDLKVRILNTGNVASGNLSLTLTGVNANVFTLPAATINSLTIGGETEITLTPHSGLTTGTYKATLTVSGEGITETIEITCTVTPTGTDNPHVQTLKAFVQNGILHVSGLTPGKPWYIYNLTGALVYTGIASGNTAEVPLPGQGLYIIRSEYSTIKVMAND